MTFDATLYLYCITSKPKVGVGDADGLVAFDYTSIL